MIENQVGGTGRIANLGAGAGGGSSLLLSNDGSTFASPTVVTNGGTLTVQNRPRSYIWITGGVISIAIISVTGITEGSELIVIPAGGLDGITLGNGGNKLMNGSKELRQYDMMRYIFLNGFWVEQ